MKKIKYRSKLRIFLGRRMLIAFMILAQLVLILALIMRGSQLRWLTYVLSALSVATALHLITRPDKYAFKILWTFLILLFPLFGGVMYWTFHFQTASTGFRKILQKIENEQKAEYQTLCAPNEPVLPEGQDQRLLSYLRNTVGFPAYEHTKSQYFGDGKEMLSAMLSDLRRAEKFIFIEYFIIEEGIMWNSILGVLRERAASLIEKVGLSLADLDRYIFEFSGGQRQRIAIARALITNAELIICDEPTSALDVSVHSQICNLLLDLREEFELTYLFISHNLSLIKHITDHMAVMYLGEVMECGETNAIFEQPSCPYTEALMSAILEVNPSEARERIILSGEARSPINPPNLCRFANRCPKACDACRTEPLPPFTKLSDDHMVRCHLNRKG